MYKIFLVEDDYSLADAVKKLLESYGNEVYKARDFRYIADEFTSIKPHLVLMDIKLPFRDGYHWTAEIRKTSTVPIVFLSSASDNMNIVMAINMGADDFIPKPVDASVLNAKVQAILRRSYEITENSQTIEFYGAVLHLSDYTISYQDKRIELTKNEIRILQVLLDNRGRIVSRDSLMTRLWQSDIYVEENTLTVNVSRLRRKLEDCGLEGVIVTKPGAGYFIQ